MKNKVIALVLFTLLCVVIIAGSFAELGSGSEKEYSAEVAFKKSSGLFRRGFDLFDHSNQNRKQEIGSSSIEVEFTARLGKLALTELLNEFEISGDIRYLEAASKRFDNDFRLRLFAALTAKSPSSEDLTKLEALEPDNALPNLLRASLFCESKNWSDAADELSIASGKTTLDLHSRERRAALLDMFIEDSSRATKDAIYTKLDGEFFLRMVKLGALLGKQPDQFGGSESAISIGVVLAQRLREMSDHEYLGNWMGNGFEMEMLTRYRGNVRYDDNGTTVAQRLAQLNEDGKVTVAFGDIFRQVLSPTTDAKTKTAFFLRARADGEMAALKWFEAESVRANSSR